MKPKVDLSVYDILKLPPFGDLPFAILEAIPGTEIAVIDVKECIYYLRIYLN